jgi:hypothetical protein
MPSLDLGVLNSMLENVNARWQAAAPTEEYHLGFTPSAEDHSLAEREQIALANVTQFMAMSAVMAAAPAAYPPTID